MFLRRIFGDYSFVCCMFIWVCLSDGGELRVLCCSVLSDQVCVCSWLKCVHMCMSVCHTRKYNRHVRAVNAQQTDILRSQYAAFCEGYLENIGRVQMRLISTGRSYQTRLGTKCERMIAFYLWVKYGHHKISEGSLLWSPRLHLKNSNVKFYYDLK